MNSTITFTVIIPAWNASATLAAGIDSVLAQTRQAQQIIIVDDGSRDDTTMLVLSGYKEAQVQLITLPANSGPAAARNAGLDAANGSHICFLDADDIWHPEKLALTEKIIRLYPEAAVWYHAYTTTALGKPVIRSVRRQPFYRLLISNPIATPCAVLPASSLRFDATMRYTEDYDYFLKAAWKKEIVFFDATLTKLGRPVLSAGGHSAQRWKMRRGEWKSYAHLLQHSPAFILLLPFLWLWSLMKHLRLLLRSGR